MTTPRSSCRHRGDIVAPHAGAAQRPLRNCLRPADAGGQFEPRAFGRFGEPFDQSRGWAGCAWPGGGAIGQRGDALRLDGIALRRGEARRGSNSRAAAHHGAEHQRRPHSAGAGDQARATSCGCRCCRRDRSKSRCRDPSRAVRGACARQRGCAIRQAVRRQRATAPGWRAGLAAPAGIGKRYCPRCSSLQIRAETTLTPPGCLDHAEQGSGILGRIARLCVNPATPCRRLRCDEPTVFERSLESLRNAVHASFCSG